MATYTYQCKNEDCNHVYEVKQSMNDEKLIKCPECEKDTLERVIQAPAFVLKGKWFKNGGY